MTYRAYKKLKEMLTELEILENTSSCLDWDYDGDMPPDAEEFRLKQLSYLKGKRQDLVRKKSYIDAIDQILQGPAAITDGELIAVNILREEYYKNKQMPKSLILKQAELGASGHPSNNHKESYQEFQPSSGYF